MCLGSFLDALFSVKGENCVYGMLSTPYHELPPSQALLRCSLYLPLSNKLGKETEETAPSGGIKKELRRR